MGSSRPSSSSQAPRSLNVPLVPLKPTLILKKGNYGSNNQYHAKAGINVSRNRGCSNVQHYNNQNEPTSYSRCTTTTTTTTSGANAVNVNAKTMTSQERTNEGNNNHSESGIQEDECNSSRFFTPFGGPSSSPPGGKHKTLVRSSSIIAMENPYEL